MKLFYITRTDISSNAAQAVQINAMCETLAKINNIDFKLISSYPMTQIKVDFCWKKIKTIKIIKYLSFVLKLIEIILRDKPTHILTRDIVVAYVCIKLGIKSSYEAHKEPKSFIARWLLHRLQKSNRFLLITISNGLKDFYTKNFGFKKEQIGVFHDGVNIDDYKTLFDISKQTLRKELGLPVEKNIMMHTGSLYKGDDAKLFKTVVDNFTDLLFVQVGGSEQDIKKYQEFYKDNDNIIFIGHQKHQLVRKYQMSADILFYALTKTNKLWWCTSPLKLFEYMATKNVILGSNIGSVGEIIDTTNAIIYNPNDKESIIAGVNLYLNDKKEMRNRAQKAFCDVEEKFTWERRVLNILEFIK